MPQPDHDELPRDLRLAAVGRIAGDIVHDANNALAVVVWNLERAAKALNAGSKEAQAANTAMESTMKAAGLLQGLLRYAGDSDYDPSLVNLSEILGQLAAKTLPMIEGNVPIHCEPGDNVGPVSVDETLLELGILDLLMMLSERADKGGAIGLRADATRAAPPEVLLSCTAGGLSADRLPPPNAILLHHVARLAGGRLTVGPGAENGCEIRLYLPRAVSPSGDEVFA